MSNELKAKGNASFSVGDFDEAIEAFSQAIAIDPSNHILYSNRSAAQASLREYELALEDAKKCVELKPEFAKGYSRLGAAYHGIGDFDEAITAYEQGLTLDPSSAQMQSALEEAHQAKAKPAPRAGGGGGGGMFSSPDLMLKLSMDPRTRGFLGQPDFMRMLSAVQSDPGSMAGYLSDPRFKLLLEVAFGMKMSTGDEFSKDQAMGEAGDEEGGEEESSMPTPAAAYKPSPPSRPQPPPEPEVSDEERQAIESKAEAAKQKELGNAAYKSKDFETAVGHYNRALDLFDGDISYLTNRAAVFFEMGRFEEAIADCDSAVAKGKELRADYKIIAKAITRKGNALCKLGRLDEAVKAFNTSLLEHRNPDTLKRLNDTEKLMKVADRCIELAPAFVKGYSRKGTLQFFMKDYDKALETYRKGLKLEADNEECREGVQKCMATISRFASGQAGDDEVKERQARSMADPEVQMILKDPIMQQVLRDFQDDPRGAQKHLKNAEILGKINKLVAAGIIQVGSR
ncbi:MAG: hypothetical protein WDW38_008669 [Sanguina aurantia]